MLLTVPEVAERLRCSTYTVSAHLRSGDLVGSKPAKRWLVDEADLAAFVAKHRKGTPPPVTRRRRRRAAA